MDENNQNNQENQNTQQQGIMESVGQQAAETGKKVVKEATKKVAKEAVKGAARAAVSAVGSAVSGIIGAIAPYVLPVIAFILVAAIILNIMGIVIDAVIDFFTADEILSFKDEEGNFKDNIYIVQHADGTYEYELGDSYIDNFKKDLEDKTGYKLNEVNLTEDLLEKIMKASIISSLPRIGDSGFQGDVILNRLDATNDENSEYSDEELSKDKGNMVYVSPNEFIQYYNTAIKIANGEVSDKQYDLDVSNGTRTGWNVGDYLTAAQSSSDTEQPRFEDIQEQLKEEQGSIESALKSYDMYFTLGEVKRDEEEGTYYIDQPEEQSEAETSIGTSGDKIIKVDLSKILMIKFDKIITIKGKAEDGVTYDDDGDSHPFDWAYYDKDVRYNVDIKTIDCQYKISQYNVPVGFLNSLLQVSSSPNWINELTNLIINDTRIDLVVHDNYLSNTSRTINNYIIDNDSVYKQCTDLDETTTVSHNLSDDVVKAKTWLYNKDIYFQKLYDDPGASVETEDVSNTESKRDNKVETYDKDIKYEYEQVAEKNIEDEEARTVNKVNKNIIYVGDTRVKGIREVAGTNGISYIIRQDRGYEWFNEYGKDTLDDALEKNSNQNVVFAFGLYDLENCDKYIEEYNKIIDKYQDTNFYFLTVNPVIDEKEVKNIKGKTIKNADIEEFNNKLKQEFGGRVIDTYSKIQDENTDKMFTNGSLYTDEGYNLIHNTVLSAMGKESIQVPSTADAKEWIDVNPFLRLWKNATGKVELATKENENGDLVATNYEFVVRNDDVNGKFVEYRTEAGQMCPDSAIISASEFLFNKLGEKEATQNYETIMRYLLNKYTKSDKYGDFKEQDILDFFKESSFSLVGGIYGGTIQEKVWFALRDLGFSEEQVAGAMGNIHYESGTFNPLAIEGGYTEDTGGIGICQWTNNKRGATGRNTNLKNYANSKGLTWQDEDTQVEFLITEITGTGSAQGYASKAFMSRGGYSINSWEKATSVDEATEAFCWTFEGPSAYYANISMNERKTLAQKYYDEFHGKTKPEGDSRIGEIILSGDNAEKMRALLAEAVQIADDDRYTYSNPFRDQPFQYDCSSLVNRLYKKYFNISVPNTTRDYNTENRVGQYGSVQLQPGDVLWKSGHVEMYIGNGMVVGAHTDEVPVPDQISVENLAGYGSRFFTYVYRFVK